MSAPLILIVLAKGTPAHPRFVIADDLGKVWTADDWSDAEEDGLLFADLKDVGSVCRELLLEQANGKPVFRFSAPVEIEIRGDKKPVRVEVAVLAIQALRLLVNYLDCGNGPLADSVIILKIERGNLKEVEK